jgi:hypothetical protein
MKYTRLFSLILAFVMSACSSHEDRLRAHVDSLPELPAATVDQLDETTMAQRHPDLGLPAQSAASLSQRPQAGLMAACCSIKVIKRLKLYMPTTWCVNPIDDLVVKPRPDQFEQGDDTGKNDDPVVKPLPDEFEQMKTAGKRELRHYKLTSFRGKQFRFPLWCQSGNGPWEADYVYEKPCSGAAHSRVVISTPGGLVTHTWWGDESNKPGTFAVIECTEVGTQRGSCGGLSTCDCNSSYCNPAEQCATCPTF